MSLQEYNNITYYDFMLKMEGYKQRQEYKEDIARTVAFSSYIAPHLDSRKMAKSIEKFWPLKKENTNTKKISDSKRAAIKKALEQEQKLKD